ncbi:hypothetical protein ACRE_062540 [Hapsidospora chrysogenum ATCC 11550]|uniref:Uncharacterized protein n=1 Tax=Hapsidospora chrysogenum (strain ATCC 11550 / CBS 779.69 / DSM 880 / IAM 14645 / JCM 23072 / IMI 49137) TaxID=857340 RepID=A0A086T0W3_HAPC1|nr:hypothetical protein ACRE_062540 [Hapsidospora chrysogenum ATCC 11550]
MAKKKSSRRAATDDVPPGEVDALAAQIGGLALQGPVAAPAQKNLTVRERWDVYFGPGELDDFQRLCADLRIEGDLSSKTKCRNALGKVHVNIPQFLNAMTNGTPVTFFRNSHELAAYTMKKRTRYFPKHDIPKGSPLRKLLRILA